MEQGLLIKGRALALTECQRIINDIVQMVTRVRSLGPEFGLQNLDYEMDQMIRSCRKLPPRPEEGDPYLGIFPVLHPLQGNKVDPNMVIRVLKVVPPSMRGSAAVAVPLLIEACSLYDVTILSQIAYILATAEHESNFKPQIERKADPVKNSKLRATQEKYWPSGFFGRGYVQITWRDNYEKMGTILDLPLVDNPDLALVPFNAARILVLGMRDGIFTGKMIKHYCHRKGYNFVGARRVINGSDRAADIALIASRYLSALEDLDRGGLSP